MFSDNRLERTLRYSIFDGVGYSFMVGAGETYFIPYAIFLGAPNWVLGLLVAFPMCLGSLSQLFSDKLLRLLGTRKRVIALGALLQGLTFPPMLLCHQWPEWSGLLLLLVICAYWTCGLILGPSWSSLMGDLVDEHRRGEYFGMRSRIIQISIFGSLIAAGLLLNQFKASDAEYGGFVVIFSIAAVARVVSFVFLLLHWEPPMASPPDGRTISMVRETLQNRSHQLLILYLSVMNFAVYLSAPFFSTYMLRPVAENGLAWSYAKYTAVNGLAMVFKFFFLSLWGRASDRFGTRKCLNLAARIIVLLPLFWLVPPDYQSLQLAAVCFAQAIGGFAWAGHELCSFNFLLDSAAPSQRPRLVASMNIVNGIMIFGGSSMGALAVYALMGWFHPFLGVFLLSSIARGCVCLFLLPGLREVRQVEAISYRSLFFRVSGVRPGLGPGIRFFILPGKRAHAAATQPVKPLSKAGEETGGT